jgi:hypothetical protein
MKRAYMAVLFVAAMLAASALGTQASAQVNLLVNPGFEASGGSYDGWSYFGSGPQISTPANDNIFRSGSAAAKIFGEFTGCPGSPSFTVGGAFQAFTPIPGNIYEFSGYSRVSSADTIPGSDTCLGNRLIAKIVFYDAASGGNEIATNEVILGDWSTPLDQWIPFSVSAPAPSNALRVQAMLLFLQPACDEGSVFVDDTSFTTFAPTVEPNVLANPSFDTNLSGWTTFGNVYYDGRSFARRTPTGGCKMYGTFTPDSDSGMFQQFPATAGSIWKLSVHAMTTCVESPLTGTNENFVLARILFKDAAGGELGGADSIVLDNTAPLGTWTQHTVYGEAPAGTDSVAAYFLFVSPALEGGAAWIDDALFYNISAVGVTEGITPGTPMLSQNVPNPFNPKTNISFEMPMKGQAEVDIYNVAGRLVSTLFRGELDAGPHTLTWDGRTSDGSEAASGVYWYVLRTDGSQTSRSMVLLK